MKTTRSRKQGWPRTITVGRESVSVYRRTMPNGSVGFMVANYSERDANGKKKRRFDSHATEADAIDAANKLARQMSTQNTNAAQMTKQEADEWANAMDILKPLGVSLTSAVSTLAACVKKVGELATLHEAVKFYATRHKQTTKKPVADVVAELLAIKESRGASVRYMEDLRNRLNRFAESFQKDVGNVTTADVQAWLDGQKFAPGNYGGYRRVIHLLFAFSVARGYAVDNVVEKVERVKVNGVGDTEVFTPKEIVKLLAAAPPKFLPCIAIGAFAGLRSAEIERLEWSDIHFGEKCVVVGASKAKTASRRIVPISNNLLAWLRPYARQQGKVWRGTHDEFYDSQGDAAKTAGLKWKQNALRHSFASYSFALTNDAGRIAGFLGNSAAVVHKHYRELVKPVDAKHWFSVKPKRTVKVLTMPAVTVARAAKKIVVCD